MTTPGQPPTPDQLAPQLAMLDVDGTLRHGPSWKPNALSLIRRLAESGVTVALSSGRPFASIRDLAEDLPQIGFLCAGSGALVRRRSPHGGWTTLCHRVLAPSIVDEIVRRAAELALEVWAYTDDRWLVRELSARTAAEIELVDVEPTVAVLTGRDDVSKLLAFATDDAHHRLLDNLGRRGDLAVVESFPGYVDIVATESAATKGGDVLTAELGLGWPQLMAVGDGDNDRGMLGAAGLAFAMAPLTVAGLPSPADGQIRYGCSELAEVISALQRHGVISG